MICSYQSGYCLPPPDDIPEEILRTEVITTARSPVDGQPLSPGEYAALMEALQDPNRVELTLPASVRELIFLLRIRRVVKPILPIIP